MCYAHSIYCLFQAFIMASRISSPRDCHVNCLPARRARSPISALFSLSVKVRMPLPNSCMVIFLSPRCTMMAYSSENTGYIRSYQYTGAVSPMPCCRTIRSRLPLSAKRLSRHRISSYIQISIHIHFTGHCHIRFQSIPCNQCL